jgi:iron complex transport system permease protein
LKYKTNTHRLSPLFFLLVLITSLLFLLSLATGDADVSLWSALWSADTSYIDRMIITEIRLPRALLAILVGATLGISGAALQGLLRNPLADPGLVGVSSCAALGAVISLYFGWAGTIWFALPLGGIIGALSSVLIVFLLAGRDSSILSLILAGVAINALASALVSLALNFSPNPYAANEIVYWLLGSLSNRSLDDLYIAMPLMLLGWLLLLGSYRFLNALSLGEDTARSLGFNIDQQRWLIIAGVALSVGAAVSISGSISFIGLVIPHLLRPWVKYEPGRLLLLSALGGAALMLAADLCVQWLPTEKELKLGVVTALIGAPFFLHLLYKQRNRML